MSNAGISHLTFIVHNLDRTARLLVEGLGARELQDSAIDSIRVRARNSWSWAVCGSRRWKANRSRNIHTAMSRSPFEAGKLPASRARLEALDVEVRPARPRSEGEREFLYFHDFDNHLSELHAGAPGRRLQADRAAHNPTVQPKGPDWGHV